MGLTAVLLVFVSVIFHASWNVALKEESKEYGFVTAFTLAAAIPAVLYLCWAAPGVPNLLTPWVYVLGSSVCNLIYFVALTNAYRAGDFSLAYPIARSAPLFVVTIAGLFLSEQPSLRGLGGIILVVLGCFLMPFSRLRDIFNITAWRSLGGKVVGFAMIAALATSGYSIMDRMGSQILHETSGNTGVLAYMAMVWIGEAVLLLLFAFYKGEFKQMTLAFKVKSGKVFLAASLMTLSYAFIMIAYQYASVSYVVGFRQLSVVTGTLLSIFILKEKISPSRMIGVIVVTLGLICIAFA